VRKKESAGKNLMRISFIHLHMAPEAVDGLAERATAQILHFSLLFSGAILQIAPAQSYFQSEIGRLLCNSQ
jgi:hypothetical protein